MLPIDNRQFKTNKAFTLIELLVVIAIIGVLAGLAVINMSGATESARIAKMKIFSSSVRTSLMANRVAEWRFDEGAGSTTTDTVGSGTGSLSNFTGSYGWRPGAECVSGACISFDGVDDYVSVPDSQALADAVRTSFSLETWIKINSYPANTADIIWKYWPGFLMRVSSGGAGNFYIYDGTTAQNHSTVGALPLNQWTHILAIRDYSSHTVIWYINGKVNSSTSDTAGALDTTGKSVYFGRAMNFNYFNGLIDETRLYNSALTARNVRDRYLAGIDQLLNNGQITKEDHQQRIKELDSEYATVK